MKKIVLCLTAVLCISFICSCTENISNDLEDIGMTENEVEQLPEENPPVNNSKFLEYISRITDSAPADQLNYLLESTYSLNGTTVSTACAVSEGKILNISSNGETTTAEIYTPETLSILDCNTKTYTQTAMDPEVYRQAFSSLESVSKYTNIEFTPSGYTVVDKDCYAEVAIIDGITKIFIFDDNFDLKYIVYATEDGALVTEEIISFLPGAGLVKPEDFTVPSDFTLVQPAE